ncbi:integrating conjugative element protein [Haemophilus paracuniculus]|uniref:Integrating conjugative element protein n=1 Tax=Haemophilus paracuniculus TaxID=734 RepID=A0A1T0AVA7_9PAST|nr:TIGR03749 family integrating conjugative element protein [Haemophilus paracuniculus]OOS00877.1 integrating conjugative element protein [Haemophilus paracuniculus]
MKKYTLFTLSALFFPTLVNAEVLMQWKRIPLPVELNVGQERIIFVDKNVQIGIPEQLDGKLSVQSTGGAVYLKSVEPFKSTRIPLRDMESGQIILLDVNSRKSTQSLDNVRIVDAEVANNTQKVDQTTVSDPQTESAQKASNLPAPAALTRYAAQSLYAPLRTVEPLEGVRRVGVKLPKSIPNLMPNLTILATPLESWGLDDYVVTAVRIKNLSSQSVTLDPRYLQGYFYAATFQHNWLGMKGTPEDTTVVYLVTEGRPDNAFIPARQTAKSKKIGGQNECSKIQ